MGGFFDGCNLQAAGYVLRGSEDPVLFVGVVFGRCGCQYPVLHAVRGWAFACYK